MFCAPHEHVHVSASGFFDPQLLQNLPVFCAPHEQVQPPSPLPLPPPLLRKATTCGNVVLALRRAATALLVEEAAGVHAAGHGSPCPCPWKPAMAPDSFAAAVRIASD